MGFIPYLIMILSNVSPLPAIIAGRRYRGVLWYYALVCITADVSSLVFKQLDKDHIIVSNLFFFTEFIIVSSYFISALSYRKKLTVLIPLILVGSFYVYHTIAGMVNYDSTSDIAYNYYGASLFYITYIIFSLLSLFRVMQKVDEVRLERSPLFLSGVAFLLYASGALFLLLFKDLIAKADLRLFGNLWIYFFLPLNIIKNLLIAVSLHYAIVASRRAI
ncbi:MAG: hypothetical protein ACK4EY_07775 [Flavipsychrobacter sp.]